MKLLPVMGVSSSAVGGEWFNDTRMVRMAASNEPELSYECIEETLVKLSRTYHEMKTDFEIWHPRLAHINPKLALMAKPDLKEWPKKCFCDSCIRGKFHRHSHSGSRPKAELLPWKPGEYYTCDVFGPLLRSIGGSVYVAFYSCLKS